ncbi:MAG: hypothetical protein IPH16_07165 [Haliscomenobacter sp.]|nr:hypothetical protein [Haliscomenobacter sp.]
MVSITKIPARQWAEMVKALPAAIKEEVMSTYDMILQEGIQKESSKGFKKESSKESKKELSKESKKELSKGFKRESRKGSSKEKKKT